MSKELIHISLHSDLKSDVKEKCEKKDITVTSYITKLIENDLKKMDSVIDGTINIDDLNNVQSELREDLAKRKFGKEYDKLEKEEQKAIRTIYPQKISEAEPKNVGGQ